MSLESAMQKRKYLSAPGLLFLVIVTQVPFIMTIYFSFTGWNLQRPETKGFLGLSDIGRNYVRILTDNGRCGSGPLANICEWTIIQALKLNYLDDNFVIVIGNTVMMTLSIVIITFILGLSLALLLNRPFWGRGLARTMLISPFLVMPVAAAVLWKNVLLDPAFGLSAYILKLLNISNFYLIEAFPMPSVVGIVSWQWTPFVMLILLAGLQSLPESTIEAAYLDGATGFNMFRFIILPHLKRFIEIALLLEVIFILNVFGEIFVTTAGGPGLSTTNLPYQIYLEAFSRWNVGVASAYGLFAIVLANIVVLLFLRVLRNQQREEASA